MDGVEYLTVRDTLVIYAEFTRVSPVKTASVLSMDGLESALAQPRQSFDGNDLYPTMPEKAAASG